jgi:drug/metabolite transporter (DMT)-like permease
MKRKYYSLLIIIAALIWSLDALFRRQLHTIPSPTLVTIENIVRLLILLPWLSRFIPEYKKLKPRDWGIVLLLGVVSGTFGGILFTAALGQVNNIRYSVVALLQQTQPIFTVLLAALILKEKITKRYSLLAIVALVAAYFLTFPNYRPTFLGNRQELIAASLALGAAAAWGSGTVLSKLLLNKLSYAATAVLRFAVVVPTAFIISLLTHQTYPVSAITFVQWSWIFFIALFGGIASFFLYYKGLQYTEAKISTFAEFTYPVSAVLIGMIFLGERMTFFQFVAALVLVIDILYLSLTRPEKTS